MEDFIFMRDEFLEDRLAQPTHMDPHPMARLMVQIPQTMVVHITYPFIIRYMEMVIIIIIIILFIICIHYINPAVVELLQLHQVQLVIMKNIIIIIIITIIVFKR